MKAIGNECWDQDLEDTYKINKLIVEKYHLDQNRGTKSSFMEWKCCGECVVILWIKNPYIWSEEKEK